MLRLVPLALSASLMISLGACSTFIGAFSAEDNIAAASSATAAPGTFNEFVRQEYVERAEAELAESDYRSADIHALKALAAAGGESVMPQDPASWPMGDDKVSELSAARVQLLEALDGGGREAAPADATHAQAMFDCWVEEQAEGHQPEDIQACREGFWNSLAKVQDAIKPMPQAAPAPLPPEPPARDYLVFFDFDETAIRTDSASILERVISAIGELGSGSVTLTGHTDTAGPAGYNQGLSEARAAAVRDYLTNMGATAEVTTSGKGESDPRVPTADGVNEQENRRVEVRIN